MEISVPVDDHVERGILKRKDVLSIPCPEIYPQWEQRFPAQGNIRRIGFPAAPVFSWE